jgi:hypothetical protein
MDGSWGLEGVYSGYLGYGSVVGSDFLDELEMLDLGLAFEPGHCVLGLHGDVGVRMGTGAAQG